MPRIFDNIDNHLLSALNETLAISKKADFCVGYFNLRGWKSIGQNVDRLIGDENNCRILIGMQKFPRELLEQLFSIKHEEGIDNKTALEIRQKIAQEFKDQLTVGVPTSNDESGLRMLSRQLKQKKVVVKLFLKHPLHAKLYLLYREDNNNPRTAFLGSSNLTFSGLSYQGELNVDVLDHDATSKLEKWFQDRWENNWCVDITDELAEIVDESWATQELIPPYYIYLKMAYHLSQEAIAGLTEFKLPKEFKDQLFEFQQKAVLISAHHLHKRNGVVIGDVVGLGKTITATALARIFEDDFFLETLIICPKNLVEMWEDYTHKYRLRSKVLPYSMVLNELPDLRRYRVVILDESHNLRNREGKRYRAIQEYIKQNDSKVIMLSATPYNKTYLDLSNQLRLFIEGDQDLGISPEVCINNIGGRVQFSAQYQVGISTLAAFEKSLEPDDWRELMRLFLIRRTRSFIKNNYALTDDSNGRKYLIFPDGKRSYFPERIPKKVEYEFDEHDPTDQYARLYSPNVIDILNGLNLPRYGLGNYVIKESNLIERNDIKRIIDNLSRAGKRLMGFTRTNLFKRLESSGYSFLLSLNRHILKNYVFIYAIENNLEIPIGSYQSGFLDSFVEKDVEVEDEEQISFTSFFLEKKDYYENAEKVYNSYHLKHKDQFDWLPSELVNKDLKDDLISDNEKLLKIIEIAKDWNSSEDRKLNALYKLCSTNHKNDKLLIFTQYADTANYITRDLKARGLDELECVTGDNENPTKVAYRFSPVSNEKYDFKGSEDELRVIISTDVLSEGQNLQDCNIIVNYDLPWAIIRLIQRAGRIDRIGQESEEITCYSFLPEDGLEEILNLRGRLSTRIKQNAEVVGTDEVFFEGDPVNIEDLYNERAGIFDEEDEQDIDLSSYAYQIWQNAIDKDPKLKNIISNLPNVVYGTKQVKNNDMKEGVVVYTRTAHDHDSLVWMDRSRQIVTQSPLKILKAVQCEPETKPLTRLSEHHDIVRKGVEYISETESRIGGQLGRTTGARYRTYMRLNRYYEESKEIQFENKNLKKAIDDLYSYPLREYAREIINRQLKAGVSDEELSDLLISLREENKLTIEEDISEEIKEPSIICSMGLVKQGN